MKSIIAVIAIVFFASIAGAQSYIDSIEAASNDKLAAETALKEEKFELAIDKFKSAIGNISKSIKEYNKLQKEDLNFEIRARSLSVCTIAGIGLAFYKKKEPDKSELYFTKAIENAQGTNAGRECRQLSQLFLGKLRIKQARYDEAIAAFDATFSHAWPLAYEVFEERGHAYFGKKDFTHAWSDYYFFLQHALEMNDPALVGEAHYNLCRTAYHQNDIETAFSHCSAGSHLGNVDAAFLLGEITTRRHMGEVK